MRNNADGVPDVEQRNIAIEWIKIAFLCRKIHVLPDPGGLFDQQPLYLTRLLVVLEEFDKKELEDIKAKQNQST